MKKISSLLLAIVMLLSITAGLTVSVHAEVDSDGNLICDGYTYVLLDDGTVEITGYDGWPKSLTVPSELDGYTVTSLGERAFYNQPDLVSIELPDTLTTIGNSAFEYCTELENVSIPESVTIIDDYAFEKCYSLSSIKIPDSVTSIGEGAFYRCDSLVNIDISENVTNIGADAFYYSKGLKNINVSPNNAVYSSEDGVLFDKDKTTIIQYPSGKEGSTYSIPNSVTIIAPRAFSFNDYLKSMDVPDSVTDIGYDAFFRCENLESATIGKGVTTIGYRLFSRCTSLKEVVLSESVPEIEGLMFEDSNNLEKVYILNKDCDIQYSYSRTSAIPQTATIYGYEGSTAQAYAEEFGIKFVPIEEPTTAETTTETTTQKPTTDATTQKPATEAATQKPTTEKSTEKPNTEASTADKNDTSKSPSTGIAAKGLFALVAIALAGGAVVFVKKKEQ